MTNQKFVLQKFDNFGLKKLSWTHLDALDENCRKYLKENFRFLDKTTIDELLAQETRPVFYPTSGGYFLNLRGINLNDNCEPEDMVSIRIWFDKNQIISTRRRPLKSVINLAQIIQEKQEKIDDIGDFLTKLISLLLDKIDGHIMKMSEDIDSFEEEIIENSKHISRNQLVILRKQLIMLKRYLFPQKQVIASLIDEAGLLSKENKRVLQSKFDQLLRFIEELDAIYQRVGVLKDELSSVLSDKMNKNMYVLSVIAAIFLPLGFLTGLLGINVGGIPGSENESAFMNFCIILVVIIVVQILLFKIKKWF